MDIKRTILIVALAVVSYMMVLQWNQDYGQAALPNQTASTSKPAPSLPETASVASNDDVPTANAGGTEPNPVETVAVSDELIQVKTDVLDLAIDPRGGDVVRLSLPHYPRRQDRPDVPFQLFDNGNEHLYLAQSGLTGANGPDARANGRPLYSSCLLYTSDAADE